MLSSTLTHVTHGGIDGRIYIHYEEKGRSFAGRWALGYKATAVQSWFLLGNFVFHFCSLWFSGWNLSPLNR